jgi:hypothetical protein
MAEVDAGCSEYVKIENSERMSLRLSVSLPFTHSNNGAPI